MSQWLIMFEFPCLLHLLVCQYMMNLQHLSDPHLNLQGYLMNLSELECVVQIASNGSICKKWQNPELGCQKMWVWAVKIIKKKNTTKWYKKTMQNGQKHEKKAKNRVFFLRNDRWHDRLL